MKWLKKLFGSGDVSVSSSVNTYDASRLVEDIVDDLRRTSPKKAMCYLVLFGDRPLTGEMGGDESIMVFSTNQKAKSFIDGYQKYYRTTKPLSALPLNSTSDLWAMLNNPAKDDLYKTPQGLIIDFNYTGQTYNAYSINQLRSMGCDGLERGLSAIWK
jgi:hypothetical protein